MPGPGFWVGIGVAILVIFALTWIGAWISRRSRLDDWAEGQDRPMVPGPPGGWLNDDD
jgi:cytochrome b